ncbi:MAG: phosphoenolpyruvate synthase, partial [Chloroflexota bacterium]|nr:phosphoenolpyruvate synthase [Chloroflexota bacterium]
MSDLMPRSVTSQPIGATLPPGEPGPSGVDGAAGEAPLIVPLAALGRDDLALAGGKGVNLGILLRAGLPVPDGFCVTTVAYAVVAAAPAVAASVDGLAAAPPEDDQLAALAGQARAALLAAPVPEYIEAGIRAAYRALGADVPVAVRSSATAEDLPTASFAGQQDTELNVVGEEAVVGALRRCWASLWTDRAVSYRARNAIDQRSVRLAVVVQRMVAAQAAGVLFTADPVTGRRDRAVVDASRGLGEAIVSGAVNPDHWVLDAASSRILEERLGDKRVAVRAMAGGGTERVALAEDRQPCLTADQLGTLAGLGRRVQALFGAPQDIEFALDEGGAFWLTQARPITTLYPLPASAPATIRETRAYFSINVAQGVFRPFTPMGAQALRMTGSSVMRALGHPPRDPVAGPSLVVEAGSRLFIDVTPLVRHPIGRRAFLGVTRLMEARTHMIVRGLADDPRFAPRPGSPWSAIRLVGGALART